MHTHGAMRLTVKLLVIRSKKKSRAWCTSAQKEILKVSFEVCLTYKKSVFFLSLFTNVLCAQTFYDKQLLVMWYTDAKKNC